MPPRGRWPLRLATDDVDLLRAPLGDHKPVVKAPPAAGVAEPPLEHGFDGFAVRDHTSASPKAVRGDTGARVPTRASGRDFNSGIVIGTASRPPVSVAWGRRAHVRQRADARGRGATARSWCATPVAT